MSRTVPMLVGCITLKALFAVGGRAADWPIHIGDRRQLFIDDRFIASSSGVSRTVNPPVKAGPIPLSTPVTGYVNGIVEHEGRYLMYHRSEREYAVSTSVDGITWECPDIAGRAATLDATARAVVFPGCEEGACSST